MKYTRTCRALGEPGSHDWGKHGFISRVKGLELLHAGVWGVSACHDHCGGKGVYVAFGVLCDVQEACRRWLLTLRYFVHSCSGAFPRLECVCSFSCSCWVGYKPSDTVGGVWHEDTEANLVPLEVLRGGVGGRPHRNRWSRTPRSLTHGWASYVRGLVVQYRSVAFM